jgi:transposase InsO family protein
MRRAPGRRSLWRSSEAVEFATLEWVGWFNHRRLLEPIGNILPAEEGTLQSPVPTVVSPTAYILCLHGGRWGQSKPHKLHSGKST